MRIQSSGLVAALLLSTALPAGALAQAGDAVDGVLACRSIADLEQRLACFDSASAELASARESGELVTISQQDVAAVEGDSFGFRMPSLPRLRLPAINALAANRAQHDALDDVATADPAPAAPSHSPDVVAPQPGSPAPMADASPAAPTAETEAAASTDVAILERSDDGDVFRVSMEIVRTRTVGYNTMLFYMANGQVWRQSDSVRIRLPGGDGPMTAEIRRAALDSYLMRINGEGRAIRVRRER